MKQVPNVWHNNQTWKKQCLQKYVNTTNLYLLAKLTYELLEILHTIYF